MFLKHLHLALLFGAVAKAAAETATSGNVSLTNSPTSHMPTTSSSNISTSTLTTTGVITTESTTRATMTVTPTNPAGETTTRNPTHPPSAPTTGAAASPTTPEANRPASMTSHATGTITTTDTSPDSTTLTPNPATATADRDATTVVTEGSASTAAPPTLGPAIECPSVPCPTQSVCLGGACQCLSGSYMKNKRCEPAQVFPGRLHFSSLTFDERMSDRSSDVFRRTAAQISAALQKVLGNEEGYIRSDVVQLQSGSVLATVNNIFEDSPATQESVDRLITAATIASSGFLNNASYEGANLCEVEPLPCDASTTTCTSVTGRAACSCRDGYVSTVYVSTSCKACPSGQRAVGDACQQCPFGYAGFNCSDSALLAVVVISCVLGGALLVVVLAVLVYYAWRRCSCRMPSYSTSPYSDDLNKSWPVSVMPIPRASTNWDAATSIELTEGGNVNVLEEKRHQSNGSGSQLKHKGWKKSGSYDLDPENMQTFKGKNSSRYSYLVQGHENPYFLPGDEKRN